MLKKIAAQMSKSCRPNGLWAALMDNPVSGIYISDMETEVLKTKW